MKSLLNSFNESIIPETGINEESSESRINFEESIENISAVNIPDFLDISPKKQSVTVHIASHMFSKVQNILDKELDLIK